MWELNQSIIFVRELQQVIKQAGWSVCLHGSVLYAGSSTKDLDLLVFPHCMIDADVNKLFATLESFGMKRTITREQVLDGWRKLGSIDVKWVEVWEYENKRVDLFVWNSQ